MSMTTHVIGFLSRDEEWEKMKSVYDACKKADVPIPEAVHTFFDYEKPDPRGGRIELRSFDYNSDGESGIEIYVGDIPKNVKIIRFYNSY